MARVARAPQCLPLADGSVPAGWWHDAEGTNRIVCDLCPRACSLKPGDRGFCFVRENVDGRMILATYGRSTGFCVDPIEKKPLNHFLPGTAVLSFGTAGCNLGCKFCQNWDISKSREVARASEAADPETIAEAAVQLGCHSVAFTYNDPIVWAEYAVDTARACHQRDVRTVAVTAGYITPEARPYFFQDMDAANVDLKAFGEAFYQQLTYSHLQPVLDTLVWLQRETAVWFEITNLVIPDHNDSPDELRRMCDWIVDSLGNEVPVHFTAFHPDFRLRDVPPTPLETLLSAHEIARRQGIKYVYVGNVHDPAHDSTYCPQCSALLIERNWHELGAYRLQGNRCRECDHVIAGRFLEKAGTWGRRRQPVRITDFAPPASAARSPRSLGRSERQTQSDSREEIESRVLPVSSREAAERDRIGLRLTQEQEQLVLGAACEFLVAGVAQRPVQLPDPTLGGAADTVVMGAFVTLTRQGHLRACCGTLGQPMSLLEALRSAAHRTAVDDMRLPPISTTELPFVRVGVSLLHDFRTIEGTGAERATSIAVGRHGLVIRRGSARGLLLPHVATENGWDREAFLRHVCHKAGLPSLAWEDSDAELQTFEARVVEGAMAGELIGTIGAPTSVWTPEELESLSQHCRNNIVAMLQGATPSYYLSSCRDGNVQGVVLSLALASRGAPLQFARLSLRPGLPFQSTLFQLCEAAAQALRDSGVPVEQTVGARVGVAILYDSAAQGTLADPDLRGLDARRRALVAAQHGRYAWCYLPQETPEQLLHSAASNVQVFDPQAAGLFSFAVESNVASFLVTNAPRPIAGPPVREPAVAGVFYPREASELSQMVERLIGSAGEQPPAVCQAVVVPHAGLRFSGHVAAAVFRQAALGDRVIVVAPKHTRLGTPWAVAPHQEWSLPGMRVASDPELARRLATAIPRLELDAAAHREEHAIEVQLPLLARLAPQVKVVGITIGEGDWDACCQFAERLAQVLREETPRPLLVISTDLNHYASDAENRRLDALALEALEQLDPAVLYRTVKEHDISMCGLLPAVVVLQTLRNLESLRTCTKVAYATSADAGGSPERVVGYAGLLLN